MSPALSFNNIGARHIKQIEMKEVTETEKLTSTTVSGLNESSFVTDIESSSDTNKRVLFKKPRVPLQQNFSVNFHESNVESDLEKSIDFSKSKNYFKQKYLTSPDPFNKFNNETDIPSFQNDLNKSSESMDTEVSHTITNVSNPFSKLDILQTNAFNVDYEATKDSFSATTVSVRKSVFNGDAKSIDNFQISFNESVNQCVANNTILSEKTVAEGNEDCISTSNKSNPFKKPMRKSLKSAFQVEFDESILSDKLEENSVINSVFNRPNQSDENFDVTYNTATSCKTVSHSNEVVNISNTTTTKVMLEKEKGVTPSIKSNDNKENEESLINEETNIRKSMEGNINLTDGMPINKSVQSNNSNVSLSKSFNKITSSETYLDQSSFNDDNLKYWMSDHSDEEIPPPSVPALPSNFLSTKEIPQVSKNSISPKETNLMAPTWEQKFNQIVRQTHEKMKTQNNGLSPKRKPKRVIKKQNSEIKKKAEEDKQLRPQRMKKPAPFATKRLYQYIIDKLKPKFGIDSIIQAEELVLSISDTVKIVTRRKTHQKKLILNLKKEMALAGLIETTVDFYDFIIKFLPHDFRIKAVPCLHPLTNTVHPPREAANPFDKIL